MNNGVFVLPMTSLHPIRSYSERQETHAAAQYSGHL